MRWSILLLAVVSCTERVDPTPVVHDDSKRLAAVRADLIAAQKQVAAEQQKNEELTRKLAEMEARLAERSAPEPAPVTPPAPALLVPAADRPSEAARTPAPRALPPSWNDVAAASDFYDATNVINRECRIQWPNDHRKFMSCVRRQQEAVATLRLGRPFGEDETRFNEARVRCARQSPLDYVKRVRCESKR